MSGRRGWQNLAAATVLASGLLACTPGDETEAEADATAPSDPVAGEVVARVNGQPITRAELMTYAGMDDDPGIPGEGGLLDELVSLELMRQEARARGIDREEETRRILRMIETNLLASRLIERVTSELELTRADLRDEYQRQIELLRGTEYRARHILVDDAAGARELVERLDQGADFAELAEAYSIDPGSAASGGDLGWFAPEQMVPAFSEATIALAPGETTAEPVESRFGWHIIRLEDTREAEVPEFDAVRRELVEILETRAIRDFIEQLRADATIDTPGQPRD